MQPMTWITASRSSVFLLVLLPLLLAAAPLSPQTSPQSTPSPSTLSPSPELSWLTLPPGFAVSVFAELDNPRQMALAKDGTVLVGSRRAGKVYALPDADQDGRADRVSVLAEGLSLPSGVAMHGDDLYVAAVSMVYRFPKVLTQLVNPSTPEVVFQDLPTDRHHGWKYLRFAPDGRLTVAVGAPCNICNPSPPYATIQWLDIGTGKLELAAQGVRNSVGFDYHPETGELWFTDNGRDWLGNDQPADELNRLRRSASHFGYPYVHGGDILDPEFGMGHQFQDYQSPALKIPAHHAPLGMTFYHGDMFPAAYQGAIILAEHGSWNRQPAAGYRVMSVHLDGRGQVQAYRSLLQGFLRHEDSRDVVRGRPADVLALADGSVLVSDDYANRIYRIVYSAVQGVPDAVGAQLP